MIDGRGCVSALLIARRLQLSIGASSRDHAARTANFAWEIECHHRKHSARERWRGPAANCSATAAPIPEVPPVTGASFPSNPADICIILPNRPSLRDALSVWLNYRSSDFR